jgi:hypothetical protein
MHLKAEIDRIRSLRTQGLNAAQVDFELELLRRRSGVGIRKLRSWVDEPHDDAPGSVEEINTLVDKVSTKPEVIVDVANLPAAAAAVRDLFAASGGYFEWAGPAKVVDSRDGGLPEIVLLTVDNVVNEVHRWGRPIKFVDGRRQGAITFPDRAARQYLAMKGEWRLPRLAGITTAPLLRADGSIQTVEGYDPETRLYCANVLALEVPSHPTEDQARAALQTLRAAFETFPFADSPRRRDAKLGLDLVDLAAPPGRDESAFLAGLITAVCRPSLQLAPGFMLVAAQTSGSGSGKGLLARAIGLIAYDRPLAGFTPTKDKGELEKRINSDLLEGGPAMFIDNVNDAVLASPTLEGAMTERPFKVRTYGVLKNVLLDGAPFIVVTGNGLKPSQDLVRRFAMFSRLDAGMENPATRKFRLADNDFLADIKRRRIELLGAALTIWRFGRRKADLKAGAVAGSYSVWARWVRDPLLELGCKDPVERIEELAADDPSRQDDLAIFRAWWERHRDQAVKAEDLHRQVTRLIDPEGGGVLQRIRPWLGSHDGTRLGGFLLRAQRDSNSNPKKRRPATYRLTNLDPADR